MPSQIYEKFFYKLDMGEMYEYRANITPDDHDNAEVLSKMDLNEWVVSYPTANTLLLSPKTTGVAKGKNYSLIKEKKKEAILYKECNPENPEDYDAWAVALYEHTMFLTKLTERNKKLKEREEEDKREAEEAAAYAAEHPEEQEPQATDFFDQRGIRMCTDYELSAYQQITGAAHNPYAQPMMILQQAPLTFEEIQAEIAELNDKSNAGISFDSHRLDYLLMLLDSNPEYRAMKEKEYQEWITVFEPYCLNCLKETRGYVPPHIFSATVQTLTQHDGLPQNIAKRLIAKKCLWLVRISTEDIGKIHTADLQNRFNPQGQVGGIPALISACLSALSLLLEPSCFYLL